MDTPLETITLPIKLTNRNDGRGHSWHRTSSDKAAISRTLTAYGHKRDRPFPEKASLTVTRILGPNERLWDADSILRGNWKEIQDTLVDLGWFKDDGPQWIETCDGRQDATRRKDGPAVMIEIFRAQ